MAYFRLNQILVEDSDQSVVCRTRLWDRLIAGPLFVLMSGFFLFSAFCTLPVGPPFLPPHYSVNSWPLFFFFTFVGTILVSFLFNLSYTLKLSLLRRTYRMTRGFFPFIQVNSGPFEDVHHISVLRAYRTGNIVVGGPVCIYSIQLEWKKMQWLYRSKIAREIGLPQFTTVELGITEDLEEAEAKAQELAAKIGVPYTGMYDPRRMGKGNTPT